MFSASSKARLTEHDLGRFPGETLFDKIARATCEAGCLPRKELYEAWEVARRTRRMFRGGRIIDLAAGHGLLAQILLILDDSSPSAIAVDTVLPPSCAKLHDALTRTWPQLRTRVTFEARSLDSIELHPDDLVVSSHACGALTDLVIDRAIAARARVAVLPCCHVLKVNDQGALSGWVDGALAVDIRRAVKLEQHGYRVRTQAIPATVTPKNRLLLATPS
ncbi:MAG: methyltransferase [Acidimicrobiia bacterium]